MINTLNESHLHEKIKQIYALEYSADTEYKIETYIADVYSPKYGIFEIQTGSFSHLRHKINFYLSEKYKVTVVFPFASEKIIVTKKKNGEIVSKRKSPLHKNYYTCFKELTSLIPFILNPNFSLHLLPCSVTEERTAGKEKTQTKNRSRHFLKKERIVVKERDLRSFIWVLEKTGIIHRSGTDGKKIIYSSAEI